MDGVSVCPDCKAFLIDMLDKRIRRILEVYKSEQGEDGDSGGSHCFHLMEIERILEGKKTCGVYDDYGDPPTIKGALFEAVAK